MSLFAPVAPIQVLEQLYNFDPKAFGDYHLLLAHHTVANEDRFRRLFERIAADGLLYPTVIMDNSVVECGGFVNFDMMRIATAAIHETGGSNVFPVLPDVMGKGQETREATLEAYERWESEIPCGGFMAVCQGASLQDYGLSLRLFSNRDRFPRIEYLGVPRILVQTIGSRKHPTEQAVAVTRDNGQKVHLLGYSDDMFDDLQCSHIKGVEGIDSAVPLRVAGQFEFNVVYPSRPKNWFDMAQLDPTMLHNLARVKTEHANGL